jgi:hypothetical protein
MQIEFSLEKFVERDADKEVRHAGLNMFEELCWINTFIKADTYAISWGRGYYANLVNPIPRGLWPGKPLMGLDYAIARGQERTEEGTTATISTGMIGQGVSNFGPFLGPIFVAVLMSVWVATLVRCDFRGREVGQLMLYVLGLALTFNLGRDITPVTLYSFLFGALIVGVLRARNTSRPLRKGREKSKGVAVGKS